MFPVYHALDYLFHLGIFVVVGRLVEVLDETQEFFHLVDFLNALHQEMLGNLAQFGQVFPLSEEFSRFFVDENPCSVVVRRGEEKHRELVAEVFLENALGIVFHHPIIDLRGKGTPVVL